MIEYFMEKNEATDYYVSASNDQDLFFVLTKETSWPSSCSRYTYTCLAYTMNTIKIFGLSIHISMYVYVYYIFIPIYSRCLISMEMTKSKYCYT